MHIKTPLYSQLTQLGFFVGLVLEKNFGARPISAFLQPLYNYSPVSLSRLGVNQSGGFLTMGLRYYFGERRTF